MNNVTIAAVDRRIEVIDGSDEQKGTIHRVSQLRDLPYVVLLGEPGSGKTTVLESVARQQGLQAVKVRALLQGGAERSVKLFLDALDEYRSDGQAKDKAHQLARAIQVSGAQSWWLTCRAEDWRKEADIQAIRSTTQGQPIVVAQLLPLSYREAAEILATLGESNAEAFLDRAESLGAGAFTQNPLSLRLLHTAVEAEGCWPGTRFALFESAVRRLAHEDNPDRRFDPRPAPDDLIAAADTANLILLVSGLRALWRSNALSPEAAAGRSAYLTAHDLGIASDLLRSALDTALFRGEGEAFEPMHRTIAEFTAARALARAVRGEAGRAAFPLSRALALITAPDGGPPTELRGLFAWFAAHLANQGDRDGALRLIETDAATVMSYGDAAVFDIECRRAIFRNLTRGTPYFRSREGGDTVAGGLAGEDLADEFAAVLRAPLDGTQRMYTVLDALQTGAPVLSLKPLLREVALDPMRPDWVRRRASEAWLNGQAAPARARRELFDALAAEPVSEAREDVRLELAQGMLDPALTTDDVKALISGFRDSGRSHTIGRTIWLKDELRMRPRPDLFDTPIKDWLRQNSGQDYQFEIDGLLDEALAAAIWGTAGLTADRLWKWIINASWYQFPRPGKQSQAAVRTWLAVDAEREIELFLAIKDSLSPSDGPWVAVAFFFDVTQRLPGSAVVHWLLSTADAAPVEAQRWLDLAFHCVTSIDADIDLYWKVYARLEHMPEMASQFERMRIHRIEPWRLDDMKRKADRNKKKSKEKARLVREWTPLIPEIANAKRPGILESGAEHYFEWRGDDAEAMPPGIPAVVAAFNHDIANAIQMGWRHILTADFLWPSAAELGDADARNNRYFVEYAAFAGLDIALAREDDAFLNAIPLVVSISILRRSHYVRYNQPRKHLEAWAAQRFCRNVDAASSALQLFWSAALDAGATHLALLSTLIRLDFATLILQQVLPALLRSRPGLPVDALRQALIAAAKQLPAERLRELSGEALASPDVKGKARRLWGYVDFALDPEKFDAADAVLPSARTILATLDLVLESDDLIDAFDAEDDALAPRRAMLIFALGGTVSPSADYPAARHRRRGSREEVVRKSIQILGAVTGPAAEGWLARLIASPDLVAWHSELRHARFQHARLARDQAFTHPLPKVVREALAGKAPANSADLRAIVREELIRLRQELRTSVDSPWREYWDNIGKRGPPPTPKIENTCRNHLILRLSDRMQPYGIADIQAERRHAEETRSDITLLSYAGWTFPVEIKRDSNAELWTAAATQLQHYASAGTADGSGLYLVFWFDHPDSPMPVRPDGGARPGTAAELETMLIADLPDDLRTRIDIIVFDVSDRDARLTPKAKKKTSVRRKKNPP